MSLWAAPATLAEEGGGPIYIELPKIDVPIVEKGHPRGMLRVFMILDIAQPEQQQRVESNLLRVQNAFLEYLNFYVQTRTPQEKEVDLEFLRRVLRERLDRMFGPGVVGAVLFRSITVQAY